MLMGTETATAAPICACGAMDKRDHADDCMTVEDGEDGEDGGCASCDHGPDDGHADDCEAHCNRHDADTRERGYCVLCVADDGDPEGH